MNLPIRTRLTAIYCTVFCLGAAVLETGAYAGLKMAISAIADRDLQVRLVGVEDFLGEHLPRLSLARVQAEIQNHAALQPNLLEIRTAQGDAIFEAPAMAPYTAERRGASPQLWTSGGSAQPLRILGVRRTIQGLDYQLWLAADLTMPFEILYRLGLLLLVSSPIVILAAAVAGHWMAGRALLPVVAITTVARTIDATDLSRRIELPENRDELRYLAETLNGMLARIEGAFRRTVEFTANASHELRTPLAVIRATAEVALMRNSADENSQSHPDRIALKKILEEAERNTSLLENLLRLARADSGTASLRLKPVDLGESLRLTCRRFEPFAMKRGIALRVALPEEPVWVSGDLEYLKCLLRILLDNAIKYTLPGGTIEVAVSATIEGSAICEVKDTGIGIAETDLPRIFERFFRSDRARNREEGGAGLGLAIAEWVARVHHGRIEVESLLGVGSTFRVVLPRLASINGAVTGSMDRQTTLQGNNA